METVCPLHDVLSRRSSDLDCMDELSCQESESPSPTAGRKRSASPSDLSSRRDVRAHSHATPPGMIRGELTGTLYAIPRASEVFPRTSSQSAGRSGQDDVPTLRPRDKSRAAHLVPRNSLVVFLSGRTALHHVLSCRGQLHPGLMVTISEAVALDPNHLDVRPLDGVDNILIGVVLGINVLRLLTADPVAGWMEVEVVVSLRLMTGRLDPMVWRDVGSLPRCMDVDIILPHLDIQLSTGNILSFIVPSLGRDTLLQALCLRLLLSNAN